MTDFKISLLEEYISEAIKNDVKIKGNKILLSYGSDKTDFILYFKYSDNRSDGSSLFNGWTAFAFLTNKELKKTSKGARILGRRIELTRKEKFKDVIDDLSDKEIGKYDGLLESGDKDLPIVFSTNLFPGTWAIVKDEKPNKKAERVWLLRKK